MTSLPTVVKAADLMPGMQLFGHRTVVSTRRTSDGAVLVTWRYASPPTTGGPQERTTRHAPDRQFAVKGED